MKELVKILAVMILFAVPAFADANLTVNSTDMAPASINTLDRTPMLNLTLNISGTGAMATSMIVNITYINVTIMNSTSGFTLGNISAIEILNASGNVIASNTTNSSAANFTIFFVQTNGFVVNSSQGNTSMIISLNITGSASLLNRTAVNISANTSIKTASNDNITIDSNNRYGFGSAASNYSSIADVHASASISPRYVDTFAFNQTFIYTVNVTGRDGVSNVSIKVPSEFSNITLMNVKRHGTSVDSTTGSLVSNGTTGNTINISLLNSATIGITINFTANASATLGNVSFNATLKDSRINVTANDNNTGVQTLALTAVNSIIGTKLTALANGTDYWEFNFTMNFSANVSGLLLFRMEDWTDNASHTMNVNTTNSSYAAVRLDADGTKSANVTNSYSVSQFMQMALSSVSQQRIALKMTIPSGTPVSSTWWAKYFMLFIANP